MTSETLFKHTTYDFSALTRIIGCQIICKNQFLFITVSRMTQINLKMATVMQDTVNYVNL